MPQRNPATKAKRQHPLAPDGGVPAWELAYLFPPQSSWTEEAYLALDGVRDTYPLVELSHGRVEVLPWPEEAHLLTAVYLKESLSAFAREHAPGVVSSAGVRVRLRKGRFRCPDVLFLKDENAHQRRSKFWNRADLVMQVVGPSARDRKRDLQTKAREYARARIPEYWIIDHAKQRLRILTLDGRRYRLHGEFVPGSHAAGVLLPGFTLPVAEVLNPPVHSLTL